LMLDAELRGISQPLTWSKVLRKEKRGQALLELCKDGPRELH
jgi:hypothetical protein